MSVTGLAYLNRTLTGGSNNSDSTIEDLKNNLIVARVIDISLNSNSKLFKQGGWGAIGTIKYEILDQPTSTVDDPSSTAKPLYPQFKNFPLVNELVLLFKLPSTENPGAAGNYEYYYLNPIGIWNHPEQNGYPSYLVNTNSPSQTKSYDSIQAGATNKENNEEFELDLNGQSGGKFVENGNVKPILPFAGDNIIEGRFSNTIRLGSTTTVDGDIVNNWSSIGKQGSPIMVLKNGQPKITGSNESWVPIVESINDDPTSIYLTSTQRVPLEIATLNLAVGESATVPLNNIISKTPIDPRQYSGSQVMVNSNRLIFNSKEDNIIMSAQKSIIGESNEDIGFNSREKNVNLSSERGYINLGGNEADESLVLGDTFMKSFSSLLKNIETLCSSLSSESCLTSTSAKAIMIIPQIQNIQNDISKFLSKKVKSV